MCVHYWFLWSHCFKCNHKFGLFYVQPLNWNLTCCFDLKLNVKPSLCIKTKKRSHVQIVNVLLFYQGQIQTTIASLSTQQQRFLFFFFYSQDFTKLAVVLLIHLANRRKNTIYGTQRDIHVYISSVFHHYLAAVVKERGSVHTPEKCNFEQEPTNQPSALAKAYNPLLFWYWMSRQTHNSSKSPHFGAIGIQRPQTQHIGLYSIYYNNLTVHLNEPNKTWHITIIALPSLWLQTSSKLCYCSLLKLQGSSFVRHKCESVCQLEWSSLLRTPASKLTGNTDE